jgi:hypothetical protein
MSGSRRLDINLHLDHAGYDREAAAARATSKKMAEGIISDADAASSKVAQQHLKTSSAAKKAAQEEQAALEASTKAQMASITNFVKMGAAMVGLQSGHAMLQSLVGDLDKMAAYSQKTAEELLKIRGLMRELAALRGEMGTTGTTVAHVMATAAQTLQTPQEVNQMEQAALGIGELAIGDTISKEDFEKALISSGKMATLEGGSADAYGALVGQLAIQSDHKLSPEEAQARLYRMFMIQQPGGFRNMTQAAGQFAELNPLIMNKILTAEEAMGTLSAFSVGKPGQAATMTDQFIRATLGNQVRARGMKIDPDLDTEKTYEYMKNIGADKTHNPIEIGKAIAADFKEQRAKDKKFDPYTYLQMQGFGNQGDREVIMTFAGLQNSDKLKKIEAAQNANLQIGAAGEGVIDQKFRDRLKKEPDLIARQAAMLDELATAQQGLKEEPYELARRHSFAQLKSMGGIYGKYEDWNNLSPVGEKMYDASHFWNGDENSYGSIRSFTHTRLRREAERIGINPEDSTGQLSGLEWDKELARQIQAKGGDLSLQSGKSLERSAASFERSTKRLEELLNGQMPPPLLGGPFVPRTR